MNNQKRSKCCKANVRHPLAGDYEERQHRHICNACFEYCEVEDQPAPKELAKAGDDLLNMGAYNHQPAPTELDWGEIEKEFNKVFPKVKDIDSNHITSHDTYACGYANGHIVGLGHGLTEGYKKSLQFIKQNTVPIAEYRALEKDRDSWKTEFGNDHHRIMVNLQSQLAAAQEQLAKVETWAGQTDLLGNETTLYQILHPTEEK